MEFLEIAQKNIVAKLFYLDRINGFIWLYTPEYFNQQECNCYSRWIYCWALLNAYSQKHDSSIIPFEINY